MYAVLRNDSFPGCSSIRVGFSGFEIRGSLVSNVSLDLDAIHSVILNFGRNNFTQTVHNAEYKFIHHYHFFCVIEEPVFSIMDAVVTLELFKKG